MKRTKTFSEILQAKLAKHNKRQAENTALVKRMAAEQAARKAAGTPNAMDALLTIVPPEE